MGDVPRCSKGRRRGNMKGGVRSGSGSFLYRTSCLMCGWHVDKGLPFRDSGGSNGIHDHLEVCAGPVVLVVIKRGVEMSSGNV